LLFKKNFINVMLDISDSEDEDVMKKFLYFLDQYINEFKEI